MVSVVGTYADPSNRVSRLCEQLRVPMNPQQRVARTPGLTRILRWSVATCLFPRLWVVPRVLRVCGVCLLCVCVCVLFFGLFASGLSPVGFWSLSVWVGGVRASRPGLRLWGRPVDRHLHAEACGSTGGDLGLQPAGGVSLCFPRTVTRRWGHPSE